MTTLQQSPESGNPTPSATEHHTEPTARRMFLLHTHNTGRIDRLYGPGKLPDRVAILSALAGHVVTRKEASWGLFRRAMLALYGVSGGCQAERHEALRVAAIA